MILVEETCSRGREGGFKLYLIGESSCFAEIEKIYGYFGVSISLKIRCFQRSNSKYFLMVLKR